MSWFNDPEVRHGHAPRQAVMDAIRVKSDSRFDALMVMFMADTRYTLSDRFLTNYHDGVIDAFTARRIVAWAKNRAEEDRRWRFQRLCELDRIRRIRGSNSAQENARQLRALGLLG